MEKNVGIYKITNLINGKVYIGQSVNLRKRLNDHRALLSRGAHENSYMQYSVNKYGVDNFTFDILELVERDSLTIRENYWMEYYKTYERKFGYNIRKPSENMDGQILSESTKKKISEANSHYTDEELLNELIRFYNEKGKLPTNRTLLKRDGYPSSVTYFNRFGNLKTALELSGLYEKVENKKLFERKEYTKLDVLNMFQNFINKYKRFPTQMEYRKTNKYNLPDNRVVVRLFGTIENLKLELGIDENKLKELEKEKSLQMLEVLYNTDGKITARSINKSSLTKSCSYYRSNFGSMENACKLAGVPYALHK